MSRSLCVVVALGVAGCRITPPPLPAEEQQMRDQAVAERRDATAAKQRAEQDEAAARATVEADGPALQASSAALAHANDWLKAAEERIVAIDRTQREREDAWRAKMSRSAYPMLLFGGVLGISGVIMLPVGIIYQRNVAKLERGVGSFETEAERREQLASARTGAAVGFAIGAGLLVLGGIIFGDGVRRQVASRNRVTAGVGGLQIRF